MFNIVDTRSNRIVAQAFDFKEAKLIATQYRKANYIKSEDWAVIKIQKQKAAPVKVYFEDSGCCDSLRDRNCEIYGRAHR